MFLFSMTSSVLLTLWSRVIICTAFFLLDRGAVIRLLAVLALFVKLCITFFCNAKTVALKRSNDVQLYQSLACAWVTATLSNGRHVTKLLVEGGTKCT